MVSAEHYRRIYQQEAERFDALVAHEDHRGQLLPSIEAITPLAGKTVAEFGAGSGRLTRLLCLRAQQVLSADNSLAMLRFAKTALRQSGLTNWRLFAADHRHFPLPADCADIALAGWTFSFFVEEEPGDWLTAMSAALKEAERLLRPGGVIIILETLGTGNRRPAPPTPALAAYYRWLEEDCHFQRRWLRTDYQFASVAEAVDHIGFFFGARLAEEVKARGSAIVPECTGLWWRKS